MKLYTLTAIFAIPAVLAATGWCLNVYKLATVCDFQAPYKCEVIRAVGIIPPIGAIVGYIDLGK